jgi:hypothetical protein
MNAKDTELMSVPEEQIVKEYRDTLERTRRWYDLHVRTASPKDRFKMLLHEQIAPALQDLHMLCSMYKAPQEVTDMFSVAVEDTLENRDTVRGLMDTTLEAHPLEFLK